MKLLRVMDRPDPSKSAFIVSGAVRCRRASVTERTCGSWMSSCNGR
jgi:hypothetical protein